MGLIEDVKAMGEVKSNEYRIKLSSIKTRNPEVIQECQVQRFFKDIFYDLITIRKRQQKMKEFVNYSMPAGI